LGNGFAGVALAVTAVPWLAGLAVSSGDSMPADRELTVILAVWFGLPHVASTIAFYFDSGLRPMLSDRRYWSVPVLLVVGSAFVAGSGPLGLDVLLIVNSLWALHHFAKQNLGMVAFAQRARRGPGLSALDRKAIVATGIAAMCGYQAVLLPKLGYSVDTERFARVGLCILAGCAVAAWRSPARAPMLLAVFFFLPLFLGLDAGQATIAYGAAHAAQYFLMMVMVCRPSSSAMVALCVSAVAGGALLVHGSHADGWIYGAVVGVNLAHFVIDAGVWKLSTPEKRSYMRERFAFL
jgi:hypothetical protein